ncbi:MAG: hypothetical protein FJ202_01895 [Gemmatimonadetes bacterium]|nr:hypothetical protein [Gemmatimonadota bacterium]
MMRDRDVAVPFTWARVRAMALTIGIMVGLLWRYRDYVPIWDGRVYVNCIMDAAFNGLTVESLRCANHPSQGWAFLLAAAQLADPGNIVLVHVVNIILGAVAIVAFRVVLARVFPDPRHALNLDLLALAAALHPVLLSTLMQPNLDFGVYVFFFVALAALLSPAGTALALLAGTLLVFSKETGVPAYLAAVGAALVIEQQRSGEPVRARLRAIISCGTLLSAPVLLFAAHVWWWNRTHEVDAIWKHGWQEGAADGFKFFDLSDPVFVSYAAGIGVLGFMWVVWAPVAIDAVVGVVRAARRQRTPRPVEGADPVVLLMLTLMTAGLAYLLTSFRTWSNVRYFALLYPLALLLMYASLVRLRVTPVWQRTVLAVVAVLMTLATVRSVDPVSRLVYGTFDTGVRSMYRMTEFTGEFEDPGRDQLVYNLEFMGYDAVQNALFERIKPGDSTVIATPQHVRWNIWSQLDPATHRRTMRRDAMSPIYADEVDVQARRSPAAWFLEFSNRGYEDRALDLLGRDYRVTDSVIVVTRGQRLIARHLVRREARVLP